MQELMVADVIEFATKADDQIINRLDTSTLYELLEVLKKEVDRRHKPRVRGKWNREVRRLYITDDMANAIRRLTNEWTRRMEKKNATKQSRLFAQQNTTNEGATNG